MLAYKKLGEEEWNKWKGEYDLLKLNGSKD